MMSYYLIEYRLQDLIGVLQIMGSYRTYKMSVEEWEDKIENSPLSADRWKTVFKNHPEFFRENDKKLFSLMWRKGLPREENSSCHIALTGDQISSLVDTAIRLHSFAIEERKWSSEFDLSNSRWKQQIVLSSFTAFLAFSSAVLAAWIKFTPAG